MLLAMAVGFVVANAQEIVTTEKYSWKGDSILQDEFKAYAVSPYEIKSDYKGRPGYFMPVDQSWVLKNDISTYPKLSTDNKLHQAIYNMGLDEMVNAVEPDTTLRTGKEWAGVWTRDVSYSIILSMAALQPEASKISLMKKVNPEGQIIQDTGSGGAWPVSTDRMIWILAAYEIYKATGDKDWLKEVYPIALRSLDKDEKTIFSDSGLVKGETSFIDWREQSYPKWMQTVDISQSEAFNTNVLYAAALRVTAEMASILGCKKEAQSLSEKSSVLARNIDEKFWMADKGYYAMYTYGRDNKILNPRAESLGHALGIIYDIIPDEKVKIVSESLPVTPFGPPVFYPQIPDMGNYHNNALWPFVASYWTLAQAKAENEKAVMQGFGSVVRPAALFATNKENLNLDNGDYFTELNSSNMLWSLAGNLALIQRILFGINYDKEGLLIAPFVPESMKGERILENFPYRGKRISVEVKGYGSKVESLTLDGKRLNPEKVVPASDIKNGSKIVVVMNGEIPPMKLNEVVNKKTSVTPVTRFVHDDSLGGEGIPMLNLLEWNPIEYISGYKVLRDGKEVAFTHTTNWDATTPGEWQVIGVDSDGVETFASEPLSNRKVYTFEMPDEKNQISNEEVSYLPKAEIKGFRGSGFRELKKSDPVVQMEIKVPEKGSYALYFRYANGNGPVNTENKCAVRSLYVNGIKVGTVVLPQRGVANWDDWGETNRINVVLPAGSSLVELRYEPEDENMNLEYNYAIIDSMKAERK